MARWVDRASAVGGGWTVISFCGVIPLIEIEIGAEFIGVAALIAVVVGARVGNLLR